VKSQPGGWLLRCWRGRVDHRGADAAARQAGRRLAGLRGSAWRGRRGSGWRGRRGDSGRRAGSLRVERGLTALRLVARGGARYASNAPRLFASAGEHRQQLRNDLALQTAEDVTTTLGTMKGVLMKLGQMASYVDDGLTPAAAGR